MRITNKMMTNNMMYNINGNKRRLSDIENQYATGLKIQRPSEDPIIAVRALKLRTNLTELNQYFERNIPDALAWMDVTESAMDTMNDILTQINTYCVQGANDPFTKTDRNSVLQNIQQLSQQIYQEGNAQYAGRYVFSGYKTDSSLAYLTSDVSKQYEITEKRSFEEITVEKKSQYNISLDQYDADAPENSNLDTAPSYVDIYRLQLSYNKLLGESGGSGDAVIGVNPLRDSDGNLQYDADGKLEFEYELTDVKTFNSTDAEAYLPEDGEIHYIADTGELIFAQDVYMDWRDIADNQEEALEFHVTYEKNTFLENDPRPEHYFDCVQYELNEDGTKRDETKIEFTKTQQEIQYEVNFNQKLTINTLGSSAVVHRIGRCIDDITSAVNALNDVENNLSELGKLLSDTSITPEQKETLEKLQEMLESEKVLKEELLQTSFEHAITVTQEEQNNISIQLADAGSRYVRLELTQSRLAIQKTDFEDLLSRNEDADVVDTIIKFKSQEAIYNASLSAAAKVVQNSLLDFL